MIVVGYPGIGKSTLSKESIKYVDFDSSRMIKNKGWEEDYVNEVIKLSKQGHIVFVSAHKSVRDILKNSTEKVLVVYPSLCLHDMWIDALRKRYINTRDEADYRALQRCVSNYCEDILELDESPFIKIKIETVPFNLRVALEKYE